MEKSTRGGRAVYVDPRLDQHSRPERPATITKKNRNKNVNICEYRYLWISKCVPEKMCLRNPATQRITLCAWKYICLLIYRLPQTLNTCNAAQTQHNPFWLVQRKRETMGFLFELQQLVISFRSEAGLASRPGGNAQWTSMPNANSKISQKPMLLGPPPPPDLQEYLRCFKYLYSSAKIER